MLVVFLMSILKKSNLLHIRSIPVIIFLLILWSTIFKLKLLRDGNNFFHVVSDARCLISPILKVLFAKIFNLQYQKNKYFLIIVSGISDGYGEILISFFLFLYFSKVFSMPKSSYRYLHKYFERQFLHSSGCVSNVSLKKFNLLHIKSIPASIFFSGFVAIFKLQLLRDRKKFLHVVCDARFLIFFFSRRDIWKNT